MAVTCSTVADRIHPYMDGELPEAARAELERHLGGCPTCREALAALEGMGRLLRREMTEAAGSAPSVWPAIAERLDPPAGVDAPGEARRRAAPGSGRFVRLHLSWRTLVPAAAAAAAVVVAVSLELGREPVVPPEQLAQVASVEGGDHASVVLLAGTSSEPPIILVTETPAPFRLPNGGSSL